MKNGLKFIALLLCVVLLFSACKKEENPQQTTESTTEEIMQNVVVENSAPKGDGKITLPFNESDGLNPFFVKSYENLYITQMLFDSLFVAESNYNIKNVIAKNISVNGNIATVTLRSDTYCRGSNPINANDVVYSFNLAKASYGWSGNLNGIASATVKSTYSVDFTLDYSDIYVAGKLTFPIVKEGTADIATAVPTGSGEYYFSENKLINIADSSKTISLYAISTRESAENTFKIGTTDVFFSDLSDCNYSGVTGNVQDIVLSNMVYLGLNSDRGALTKHIRSAIVTKIDTEEIVISSYQGHGVAVKMPVSPKSTIKNELTEIASKGNTELANQILDRCGYIRYSGNAKTNGAYLLTFSLIVNNDNKFRVAAAYNIADSLKEIGFLIRVEVLSYNDYQERISSGNYDMYIGEIKLDGTMDISAFFTENGFVSAGINKNEKAATEYFRYRAGEINAKEYYDIFIEEYPFVPLLFRTGYVVNSSDLTLELSEVPFSLYNF